MDKAKQWYSKTFECTPYFDEPFYVGFNIGGYELGLQPSELNPEEKKAGSVTYWGVEDVLHEFNRMLELGAGVHEQPRNVGGDIEVASVYDPWNNIIGIIYNPGFKVQSI